MKTQKIESQIIKGIHAVNAMENARDHRNSLHLRQHTINGKLVIANH